MLNRLEETHKEFTLLIKWIFSLIDASEFYLNITDHNAFKAIFDKTTHADMLLYDYFDEDDAKESKKFLEKYLHTNYHELFKHYEVAVIVKNLLADSKNILFYVRYLSNLHNNGYDFIPSIFVGIASETDHIPIEAQKEYWNEAAYSKAQKSLHEYNSLIINEVKKLQERLLNEGIRINA